MYANGYDAKADIWSLAISCIDMAQREPPRFDIIPSKVVWVIPHMPPPTLKHTHKYSHMFNHFLAYALVKDPAKRPSAEQLLKHPFIIDAQPCEEVLAPLLAEAAEIICAAGGIELALKAAKIRLKARERELQEQQEASEAANSLPPIPDATVHHTPYAGTLIPIAGEDDSRLQARKKRMIKGKIGRFLHRRPKPNELIGRGIIQDDLLSELPPEHRKSFEESRPQITGTSGPVVRLDFAASAQNVINSNPRGSLPPASLSTPPLQNVVVYNQLAPVSSPTVEISTASKRKSLSRKDAKALEKKEKEVQKAQDEDDGKKKKGIGSIFGLRKKV